MKKSWDEPSLDPFSVLFVPFQTVSLFQFLPINPSRMVGMGNHGQMKKKIHSNNQMTTDQGMIEGLARPDQMLVAVRRVHCPSLLGPLSKDRPFYSPLVVLFLGC